VVDRWQDALNVLKEQYRERVPENKEFGWYVKEEH
jgi:hypothetical protein